MPKDGLKLRKKHSHHKKSTNIIEISDVELFVESNSITYEAKNSQKWAKIRENTC